MFLFSLLAIISIASATDDLLGCNRNVKGNKNGFTVQVHGIIPASQPTGQIQLAKACKGNLNEALGAKVTACDDVPPSVFIKYDLATANIYRIGSLQNAVKVDATVYCRLRTTNTRKSLDQKSVNNYQKPSTDIEKENKTKSNINELSTESQKSVTFEKEDQIGEHTPEADEVAKGGEVKDNRNITVKTDSSIDVTQIPVTEKSNQTTDTTRNQIENQTQATASDQTVTEHQTVHETVTGTTKEVTKTNHDETTSTEKNKNTSKNSEVTQKQESNETEYVTTIATVVPTISKLS